MMSSVRTTLTLDPDVERLLAEEVHRLRLLERKFVGRVLRRQGFRVRVINGYGALRFARGHVGFVARKA